jgi:hypothetical protein
LRQEIIRLGCVMAGLDECEGVVVVHHERHHTGMSQRAGDDRGFGLCRRHHTSGKKGVAIHASIPQWEALWGTQDQWIGWVHRQLKIWGVRW